ncbi:cytochrome b [Ferrimonas balearica]|uniref:cytochrome b n=1 Tax=Ferrimonas balearica TaxID=44012 RepID=UPI001C9693A6|nr:cytochrome b/b6 domain-containing protein [Ferrimonas balearica]MBY6225408.1 cytochrome b/b6 domain-containing protein [Ferrimonas balearica]
MKYSLPLRAIHWLMALMMVGLIAVGWYMAGLDRSPFKFELYGWHKSFGFLALLLLMARLLIRRRSPIPSSKGILAGWEIGLSHATHWSLYLLMLLVPLSGYIMSSIGRELTVFGLTLPSLVPQSDALQQTAHSLHGSMAYLMLALMLLHLAGALKHRLFDDRPQADVLPRML